MLEKPVQQRHVFASDHPCFMGHFTGNPLVPGVLLLGLANSLVLPQKLHIRRIVQAKFLHPLRPNEPCDISLTPTSGNKAQLRASCGAYVIAQGVVELAHS